MTYQTMFHRVQPLQFYDGASFGDANYASTSRVTWTPYYADDGAYVVHLGASYQIRSGNLGRDIDPGGTGNTAADALNVVRFRARGELRDAVGISPVLGDGSRFIDTGYLIADQVQTLSPEFMVTYGPFNFRADAAFARVENARSIYPLVGGRPNLTDRGNPTFWGGYVQASYFLTGEHWGYDRRFGTVDRPKVNENFFFVRDDAGDLQCGLGAWEIAYRFSYVDLNDNGINGGQLGEHTFGINWYMNDNARLQINYLIANRYVVQPARSGMVQGVGAQWQWYF